MTTLTRQGDVCVLTVEGELNRTSVGEFQTLVDRCLIEDARDFIIDFADCTGADSAALEALTWLTRECVDRLGMCKLCNLSDTLETILRITRLDGQLGMCVTMDEALAALKQT
jgi:anti-anti-sigma factor